MANELIINVRPYETRVALVENGLVTELHIERKTGEELMGNIYRGKVVRVLPGMQAAFVDIGLSKMAFLYVGDVTREMSGTKDIIVNKDSANEEILISETSSRSDEVKDNVKIEILLHEKQSILVQVIKEPYGTKGARISSHISIPGRHLVLIPTVNHIGVSRKIEDIEERDRLKNLVDDIRPREYGFIVRTATEGVAKEKIESEIELLLKLMSDILLNMKKGTGPALLYKEVSVSVRAARDLFTREIDQLVIDSAKEFKIILEFIRTFAPHLESFVDHYKGSVPIFDKFGIEIEISRALSNKIWLKSGGYIVIELTEALTSIDVNTGSYVGHMSLEETILKTNLEALKEIAYQLRLRNIGGIIVIDFIDMEKIANRERVFMTLKDELKKDKVKTNVLQMSDLGLIEMTRKRTRANLNSLLTESCSYCEGRGVLKSSKTICYEIFRDLEKESQIFYKDGNVSILVNPAIERVIKEDERESVIDLEKRLNKHIIIAVDPNFHLEQYELDFYEN